VYFLIFKEKMGWIILITYKERCWNENTLALTLC
jgi:hypothetical protein